MKSKIAVMSIIFAIALFTGACQRASEPNSDNETVPTIEEQLTAGDDSELVEHAAESEEDIWRKNSSKIIDEVKNELENKGWSIIKAYEGWGDWEDWGIYDSELTELTEDEEDMFIYTVWGQWEGFYENYIDAVVRIAFSSETPEGEIYKVFYHSTSGRYLAADEFGGYSLEDDTEILSVNDERLLDFMYSY